MKSQTGEGRDTAARWRRQTCLSGAVERLGHVWSAAIIDDGVGHVEPQKDKVQTPIAAELRSAGGRRCHTTKISREYLEADACWRLRTGRVLMLSQGVAVAS